MATTTNYGWTTPDNTDLVKDGASAIRTLGSSIDTTTKNLNPSTTLGDIEYRSATANTNTRLALGTAGQVLTVNSGATAPQWATPAAIVPANATATVATYESTTSTTYTNLTTSGPAVTVTTGTKALVIITSNIYANASNRQAFMSYEVSGASTITASDTTALSIYAATVASNEVRASCASVSTLTAGSNTFTAKYRISNSSASASFSDRAIFVINLA
jgi:hypothetical protein